MTKPSLEKLNAVAPFATLASLILALIASYSSCKHQEKTKSIQRKSEEIIESLSTKFEGTFPANMESIRRLLSEANDSVLVVADFPAYGRRSREDEHHRYRIELETLAARDINMEMLYYSVPKGEEVLGEYLLAGPSKKEEIKKSADGVLNS